MRCPYCGTDQTEVLRAIHRRHKTYRYRKCHFCKARFRTQEKPVRWEGVDRKWPGTPPSRNGWRARRVSALRGTCEVVSCGVTFTKAGPRRHVDHIVPARLIRRLRAGNPDRRENLECICGTCHGYKLQADHKLCMGDKLGYLEIRSQNDLTAFAFAKDYDAIVTVNTEIGERSFALEFERTPKPAKRYRAIAAYIRREVHVNRLLCLAANYDILRFVSSFFADAGFPVFFGLATDWHSHLLEMPVMHGHSKHAFPLRQALNGRNAQIGEPLGAATNYPLPFH
jgi:HNH endonuclease